MVSLKTFQHHFRGSGEKRTIQQAPRMIDHAQAWAQSRIATTDPSAM
jgi:hypothetical protein